MMEENPLKLRRWWACHFNTIEEGEVCPTCGREFGECEFDTYSDNPLSVSITNALDKELIEKLRKYAEEHKNDRPE